MQKYILGLWLFILTPLGLAGCSSGFDAILEYSKVSTSSLSSAYVLPPSAPLPNKILDNSTVFLKCGTNYYGSLDLTNRTNVTLTTEGACGPATITPAVPVSGWKFFKGNIYVTTVPKEVAQVFVNNQLMGEAHFPNSLSETGWLQPSSVSTNSMKYSGLPSNDIIGAKANYRGPYPWAIGTRTVASYDGVTINLPPPTDNDMISEDSPLGKFYLEGKLWMLDSPGEWAWSDGKLYLWMPDGTDPMDRVLAAPSSTTAVIDARASTNVVIKDVKILGGWIGVDASFLDSALTASKSLQIVNTEVAFSNWSAIYATDADKLTVNNSEVVGALHTGIYARYGSTGTVVMNSRFTNVNNVGMHKGSDGSIFLNSDDGAIVTDNTVTNSGKSGIYLGSSMNSQIKGNKVNGACRVHGDCGGIYVIDRDQIPLNTTIENNLVTEVNGPPVRPGGDTPERYGIYLDDYSTGVKVIGNTVINGATGMQLHGAFNNTITGNNFRGNLVANVLFSEGGTTAGGMHGNAFTRNIFTGPVLSFYFAVNNPATTASFSGNTYLNYGNEPIGNVDLPY